MALVCNHVSFCWFFICFVAISCIVRVKYLHKLLKFSNTEWYCTRKMWVSIKQIK